MDYIFSLIGYFEMNNEQMKEQLASGFPLVSHQWCDLFYRLLHSYTRHEERVARGERDIVLSA